MAFSNIFKSGLKAIAVIKLVILHFLLKIFLILVYLLIYSNMLLISLVFTLAILESVVFPCIGSVTNKKLSPSFYFMLIKEFNLLFTFYFPIRTITRSFPFSFYGFSVLTSYKNYFSLMLLLTLTPIGF